MKSIITNSIEQTYKLANNFAKELSGDTIVCLEGDLGAGKTTFTQGVLSAFDAEGPYTSPTFNIVKEYDVDKYGINKIYHIDAYRITSDDMQSIGWDDIITNKSTLVMLEWPENVANVLPQNTIVILCQWVSQTSRKYTIKN